MYLLPYLRIPEKAPGLQQVWLFLERNGTHLISIEETVEEFCESNGLVLAKDPFTVGDIVYCEVSKDTQDLANFYVWNETPAGTTPPKESWRSFLWASSAEGVDPWGVNRLMESISLSESHSVYSVLSQLAVTP